MERPEQGREQNDTQGQQWRDPRLAGLVIHSIVHSFNNAIGLIRGYADLSLRLTAPDNRIYPYLKNIIDGTDSMKELSEKMRIFGKQTKQNLKLMQIHPVIEKAVHAFTRSLPSSIKIQQDIDIDCGEVLADSDQIK